MSKGQLLSPHLVPRHFRLSKSGLGQGQGQANRNPRYKNQAAVQAHVKSAYFRDFAAKMAKLTAKPSELRAGGFLGGSRGVSRL